LGLILTVFERLRVPRFSPAAGGAGLVKYHPLNGWLDDDPERVEYSLFSVSHRVRRAHRDLRILDRILQQKVYPEKGCFAQVSGVGKTRTET